MPDQERRRFFRIDDTLKISYRPITAEELALQNEDELPRSPLAALHSMDKRIHELVNYLQVQSPDIAEAFGMLNKKIDAVIDLVAVESGLVQQVAFDVRQVNISACGIAFPTTDLYDIGDLLHMDLVLMPGDQQVALIAKVIESQPLTGVESHKAFSRFDFIKISTTDQEVLIQHLVKRQVALFRAAKHGSGDNPTVGL